MMQVFVTCRAEDLTKVLPVLVEGEVLEHWPSVGIEDTPSCGCCPTVDAGTTGPWVLLSAVAKSASALHHLLRAAVVAEGMGGPGPRVRTTRPRARKRIYVTS